MCALLLMPLAWQPDSDALVLPRAVLTGRNDGCLVLAARAGPSAAQRSSSAAGGRSAASVAEQTSSGIKAFGALVSRQRSCGSTLASIATPEAVSSVSTSLRKASGLMPA